MASAEGRRWFMTWRGRSLLALLSMLAMLVLVFVMLWLAMSNEVVSRRVVALSIPTVNEIIPGQIRYSSFHGTIGSRVVLENLEILDDRGELCLRAKRLEVDWDLWDLRNFSVDVSQARLVEPEVLITIREDGSLNLVGAFDSSMALIDSSEPREDSRWSVHVGKLSISDGTVSLRRAGSGERPDLELRGLQVESDYHLSATDHHIRIERLSGSLVQPLELEDVQLSGLLELGADELRFAPLAVVWRDSMLNLSGVVRQFADPQVEVTLGVERLALSDLKELSPATPLRGVVAGDLRLSGPLSELQVQGLLSAGQGKIAIRRGLLAAGGPALRHELDVELQAVDLAQLFETQFRFPPSLSLQAQWSGQGMASADLDGRLEFSASPFESYGHRLSVAQGVVRLRGNEMEVQRLVLGLYGGQLAATGRVRLASSSFTADVDGSFPKLAPLAALVGVDGFEGSLELDAALSGSWDPAADTPLHTEGNATIGRLKLGSTRASTVTANWNLRVEMSEGSVPALHGPLDLVARSLTVGAGRTLRRASIETRLVGRRADYSLRASNGSELLLSSVGQVDWSKLPSVSVRGHRIEMLAGDFLLQGSEPFSLQIREGTYQLDRLRLVSGDGSATIQGTFDGRSGTVGLSLRIRGLDLGSLSSPIALLGSTAEGPLDLGLDGLLEDLLVKATGPLTAPRLSLSADVKDLELQGRGPIDVSGALRYEEGVLSGVAAVADLASLTLKELPLTLRLDGGVPWELSPEGLWDLQLDLARSDTAAFVPLLGREMPEELAGGTLRGGLSVVGPTRDLRIRADLGLSDLEVAGQRLHGQLGLRMEEGQLQFEDALLKTASVGRILKLEGRASAQPGAYLLQKLGPASYRRAEPIQPFHNLELSVGTRKLPMSLAHLLLPGLTPLTGALQGQIEVTGQLDAPEAQLRVRLLDGRVGREELKELRLEAGLERGRLRAEMEVQGRRGGTLRLDALSSLPVSLGASREEMFGVPDLEAQVVGDGFPLALISAFVPGVTDSAGELRIDGVIGGSLLHPEPQLALELEGGKVCHDDTSVCYDEVLVDARLETGRLTVQEISFGTIPQVRNPLDLVRTARPNREASRFKASGFVLVDGLRPKWTQLDLELSRAWAAYTEQVKVQVDGDLRIRGYYPALKVSGVAELQNVRVDLGRATTRRETQSLELPINLHIHRRDEADGDRVSGGTAEEVPSLLDTLMAHSEADITIKLGNNVRTALAVGIAGQRSEAVQALNLLGSIEPDLVLGGEVNLRHEKSKTALVGAIALERGSRLTVLTRDFLMDEGSAIEFVGNVPDSQLNLRATHNSRYGPVTVVVTERMASPSIRFESEVFEDQADILSVLVTGKPISELSTAEGTQALSGIAGALAGFGTKAFGKYTPFDSLVVDLGDDISSGSAEAGKALGSRVFLVTRFRWGTEEGENRIEGQLEVQINPRLYFETLMGDRLQGAAKLVFKRQF